jgi:hypothetical protein
MGVDEPSFSIVVLIPNLKVGVSFVVSFKISTGLQAGDYNFL